MYCSLKEAWGEPELTGSNNSNNSNGSNNDMNKFSNGMLPNSVGGPEPTIPNGGPTINNLYHGKCTNKSVQQNMQNNQQEILSTPYAHLSRYRKNTKPKTVPQQFILAQPNSDYNHHETVGSHLACDSYLQHVQGCEECLQSVMSMYHPEDINYFRMYNNQEPGEPSSNSSESYSEMNNDNEKPIHPSHGHNSHAFSQNNSKPGPVPVAANLNSVGNRKEQYMNPGGSAGNIVTNANIRQNSGGIELNDITNLVLAVLAGILLIYGLDTVMKVLGKIRR